MTSAYGWNYEDSIPILYIGLDEHTHEIVAMKCQDTKPSHTTLRYVIRAWSMTSHAECLVLQELAEKVCTTTKTICSNAQFFRGVSKCTLLLQIEQSYCSIWPDSKNAFLGTGDTITRPTNGHHFYERVVASTYPYKWYHTKRS